MCVLSPGYLLAEHEAIDMETAGGGQIWQSWAILPSEHDFGR